MLAPLLLQANPEHHQQTQLLLHSKVLHQFYEELKDVPADKMDTAVHELLKKTVIDHKRVIFNGNGYTDEWIEESRRNRTSRGNLYNLVSSQPEHHALPHLIDRGTEKKWNRCS